MTTFTATTSVAKAGAAPLADLLEGLDPAPYGVGVFEIEDGSGLWEVAAYFMEAPDEVALALAAAAFGARPFAVSEIGERDWVSEVRRELAPVRAGRFLVHGAHDRIAARNMRHALEIEAAMAFGTGHHGTTRGCLNALDRLAKMGFRPRRIADIGCGTGVLAMAAASLWKRPCVASDIDPVAVATAKANFRANGLTFGGRLARAAGFRSNVVRREAPYHLIFANILANPLKRLAPDMARHTAHGGVIVLSGVLNEQRAGVESVYLGNGFRRMWISRDGEWSTLVLRRT
ncbi:MAG: 50S ribosomal protein L11 methyltransferase [Pseudomonadota bacterium]